MQERIAARLYQIWRLGAGGIARVPGTARVVTLPGGLETLTGGKARDGSTRIAASAGTIASVAVVAFTDVAASAVATAVSSGTTSLIVTAAFTITSASSSRLIIGWARGLARYGRGCG